jgi:hypothetical protein
VTYLAHTLYLLAACWVLLGVYLASIAALLTIPAWIIMLTSQTIRNARKGTRQ